MPKVDLESSTITSHHVGYTATLNFLILFVQANHMFSSSPPPTYTNIHRLNNMPCSSTLPKTLRRKCVPPFVFSGQVPCQASFRPFPLGLKLLKKRFQAKLFHRPLEMPTISDFPQSFPCCCGAPGDYVRYWVPELAELPMKYLHCPWEVPKCVHSEKYHGDPSGMASSQAECRIYGCFCRKSCTLEVL